MKFTLEIELGDGNQTLTYGHIRQALQNVRSYLSQYRGRCEVVELNDNAEIRDANGNTAGKWAVVEDAGEIATLENLPTASVPYVEVNTETAYGRTSRMSRSVRVF
jgi:hypothetical protein